MRVILVPAQEERGVASIVKAALATAPQIFSQCKKRFNEAADKLVGAAQDSGDIRRDVGTHDILRMTHGIATASKGEPEPRERMLTVMFDGLRPA